MGDQRFTNPGQRWRSLVDGDTVVTGEECGDQIFVWFERFRIAIAVKTVQFVEDYEFVGYSTKSFERPEFATSPRSTGA